MFAVLVGIAVLLIAFGGLLAAADAALGVLSRADLGELASQKRSSRSLLAIAADVGAHANALAFVRILSETTAAVLVTLALTRVLAPWWWVLLAAVFAMTLATFVLVGSSPRSVGRAHPRSVMAVAAPVVRAVRVLLGPLADALVALGNRVTPGRPRTATFSSEEQLLSMVDEAAALEVLEEDDRELIHSIFEWGDTVVREVMVPRPDMHTIDDDVPLAAAMEQFLSTGHSRMPVVGKEADEVVGVLYLKDVARQTMQRPEDAQTLCARDLARPAAFVPESKKADDTLHQMQRSSNHLALVVDEYDRETPDVVHLGGGVFRVSARLPLDDLGDLFGIDLEDDEVDTAGGLLTKVLGRLPQTGSTVEVSGLRLRADRVEGRRTLLRTIVVEADRALLDATAAFETEQESE